MFPIFDGPVFRTSYWHLKDRLSDFVICNLNPKLLTLFFVNFEKGFASNKSARIRAKQGTMRSVRTVLVYNNVSDSVEMHHLFNVNHKSTSCSSRVCGTCCGY